MIIKLVKLSLTIRERNYKRYLNYLILLVRTIYKESKNMLKKIKENKNKSQTARQR